jgi:hypothetical protein
MNGLRVQPRFVLLVLGLCVAGIAVTTFLADWRTAWGALVALIVGLWGSYALGARTFGGPDDPRGGARQALRQIVTHYRQLSALEQMVEGERAALATLAGNDDLVSLDHVDRALYHISFQLTQQLSTANDAIDNWRELLPDEVRQLESGNQNETEGGSE